MFFNSNQASFPSLSGGWVDTSTSIGYSSAVDSLHDAFTRVRITIAQQIFQKAIEKNQDIVEGLSEDQIFKLMRNFTDIYWSIEPNYSKSYVLIDTDTLKCKIEKDINEAKKDTLEGYTKIFEIIQ